MTNNENGDAPTAELTGESSPGKTSDIPMEIFDPREIPHYTDKMMARINIAAASKKGPDDTIEVKLSDLYGVCTEVQAAHSRMTYMLGLEVEDDQGR